MARSILLTPVVFPPVALRETWSSQQRPERSEVSLATVSVWLGLGSWPSEGEEFQGAPSSLPGMSGVGCEVFIYHPSRVVEMCTFRPDM